MIIPEWKLKSLVKGKYSIILYSISLHFMGKEVARSEIRVGCVEKRKKSGLLTQKKKMG